MSRNQLDFHVHGRVFNPHVNRLGKLLSGVQDEVRDVLRLFLCLGRGRSSRSLVALGCIVADAPEEIKHLLSEQAVTPSLALATLRTNGSEATAILKARVEAAKTNGHKTAKRDKAPTTPAPAKAKEETKNVSNLVLYAAEELAKAVDVWIEDATVDMEIKLIAAHKAYRKLIPAPRQAKAA